MGKLTWRFVYFDALPREKGVFLDKIGISSSDEDLRLEKRLHRIASTGDDSVDCSLVACLLGFVTFSSGMVTLGVVLIRSPSLGAS